MSRYVMVNGVKTHFWEADGDGPTIIALHGGGAGSSGMAGMGPLLERLGGAARVIAPDSVGGFGMTDPYAPVLHGLLSRVEHTADFIDTLCLDKVSLIGNSQGAWTAVQYALRHPGRVEKIILISSLTIANSLNIKQRPTEALQALNSYDGTREGMVRILKALVIDPARITDKLIRARWRPSRRSAKASLRCATIRCSLCRTT
jgi:pimeloyl-ACP methyl ester carboxylesterase